MPQLEIALSLVAGGDISLHGIEHGGEEAAKALQPFPAFVRAADIAVANLECALTKSTEPAVPKKFLFRADPAAVKSLRSAGLDALSLANNHSGDFGTAGLKETVRTLENEEIGHFGNRPWTIETEVGKLAFFGINFIENEHAERDSKALAHRMTQAASDGSTVIVMPHWGREYSDETTAEQRSRARWLIDHGADIIIGSHSHRGQPLDYYRGRPIFYSLGNAFFPGNEGPKGFHLSHWAQIEFGKDGRRVARLVRGPEKRRRD